MERIQIRSKDQSRGHPWVELSGVSEPPASWTDGMSLELNDPAGRSLGCGILDLGGGRSLWRRYSHAEGVSFDAAYLSAALVDAIERRTDESCQRLISSDADYLPGLTVELFGDVLRLEMETAAVCRHEELIIEVLKDLVNPVELVIDQGDGPRTAGGQGLKGRWIEVDELMYRIDMLNPKKPCFYLDQREQHPLVGSLCADRSVLDVFSHNGAFALQAARAGAGRVVAVEIEEEYVKAIGANAQRNELPVETVAADALAYLREAGPGVFDAMVLDPPSGYFGADESVRELHRLAFASLPQGGLLATYCRAPAQVDFEALVAQAAADVGREARIFARTSQPFDFPMLLNFPESQSLSGLILQVE